MSDIPEEKIERITEKMKEDNQRYYESNYMVFVRYIPA